MARSGRLRRPGRGLKHEDQSNPKTGPGTPLAGGRFRLIVDSQSTFNTSACAPPRRTLDDVVSPSTIRLKRASTIAEIRNHGLQPGARSPDPPSGGPGLRILAPALQGCRSNAHFARHQLQRCALRRQRPRHRFVLECLSVSSQVRPSSPPPGLINGGDNYSDAGGGSLTDALDALALPATAAATAAATAPGAAPATATATVA